MSQRPILRMELFRKLLDGQVWIALCGGAFGVLQPCSSPSVVDSGFHHHCGQLVFKITMEVGREMGTGQVTTPQSSLFLLRFTHFSWVNVCQIVESLLLISRVLKKMIFFFFDNFCQCSHCFYGRMGFRGAGLCCFFP